MYTFFKTHGSSKFLVTEVPALWLALILSELAYKFGSFMVECIAFLVTWYVIGFVIDQLPIGKRKQEER